MDCHATEILRDLPDALQSAPMIPSISSRHVTQAHLRCESLLSDRNVLVLFSVTSNMTCRHSLSPSFSQVFYDPISNMLLTQSHDALCTSMMGMHLRGIPNCIPARLGKNHSAVLSACTPSSTRCQCIANTCMRFQDEHTMFVGQLRDELAEAVMESARAEARYCLSLLLCKCYFKLSIFRSVDASNGWAVGIKQLQLCGRLRDLGRLPTSYWF